MDFLKEIRLKIFYLIYYVIKAFTKTNDKRILFESYWGGSVSCNPKAMMDYMIDNGYDYEYIFVYNAGDKIDTENIKYVNMKSLKYLYYRATSKYWVSNTHIMGSLKPRKDQVYMQTWHGAGAFKKFGLDIIEDRGSEKAAWRRDADNWNYLLCSSDEVRGIYSNAFGIPIDKVYPTGLPRNDYFYDDDIKNKFKKIINELVGNKDGKKIVLYAPTFRDNNEFKLMLDFEKLYNKFADKYIFILKLHPNIMSDVIKIDDKYKDFVFNFSNYGETQELLLASDVLITDYSSIIFDFALTGNPILFYAYDLELYKEKLRGFYYEYEKFVPGPIIKTESELIDSLNDFENLKSSNKERIEKFARKFNTKADVSSTKLAVDLLLSGK